MEILIAIVIVLVVAAFVAVPFRVDEGESSRAPTTDDPVLADLEARKQAKYREIRDTELDRAQGKLSDVDFRRQDAELRAEAIAILKEIDERTADGEREAPADRGGPGHGPGGDSL